MVIRPAIALLVLALAAVEAPAQTTTNRLESAGDALRTVMFGGDLTSGALSRNSAEVLYGLLLGETTTFPIGSSAGGFTWIFDSNLRVPVRRSSSFGPMFAERPFTTGKARLNVGATFQHTTFASVGDHLPEPVRLKKTVGRMATYLQAYGDLLVETNRWDPAVLARFRADPFVASFRGAIDSLATTEQLEHVATLIPTEWLEPAATGSARRCVEKIRGQLELGADGVILHGASPRDLAPIVEEYRRTRPAGRFDHLAANPAARSGRKGEAGVSPAA